MKNKLKLIIFVIFVSLITSGCTLNYNITIKENLDILESAVVTEDNSVLTSKYGDYKKEIKRQQNYYKKHQLYYDYASKKIYDKNSSGLELYKEYPNGTFDTSPNILSVFQDYSFRNEIDSYVLELSRPVEESLYPDTPNNDEKLDKVYVNIRSYLKVLDTNSDSYDEKTKTYTWNLDDNFFRDKNRIYIKLSKEKDNENIYMDFFKNNSTIIISILIVLTITAIISIYLFAKYKKGMRV